MCIYIHLSPEFRSLSVYTLIYQKVSKGCILKPFDIYLPQYMVIVSEVSMSRAVKVSEELLASASLEAKVFCRSNAKQIEHWARIGRIAEQNPDMPYMLIKEVLLGLEEAESGFTKPYQFD